MVNRSSSSSLAESFILGDATSNDTHRMSAAMGMNSILPVLKDPSQELRLGRTDGPTYCSDSCREAWSRRTHGFSVTGAPRHTSYKKSMAFHNSRVDLVSFTQPSLTIRERNKSWLSVSPLTFLLLRIVSNVTLTSLIFLAGNMGWAIDFFTTYGPEDCYCYRAIF